MATIAARRLFLLSTLLFLLHNTTAVTFPQSQQSSRSGRERVSINNDWKFWRFESNPDGLNYNDIKEWILPSANDFIAVESDRHIRPKGSPGSDVTYVQSYFNDDGWETVDLPHDWAIKGPFYVGDTPVPGGMGRLPIQGVGWYRKSISIDHLTSDQSIYLEIDGAMSYSMVWCNGQFVGGWPYGYNSYRLDLTPYLNASSSNQLAIRLDNPTNSARWYPGGGLYRNVWLTRVSNTHVGQWGTFVTTPTISSHTATINLKITVENSGRINQDVDISTEIKFEGRRVGETRSKTISTAAGKMATTESEVTIRNPKLWGPPPLQTPNLYTAVTTLKVSGHVIDRYETSFGIRSLTYKGDGLYINGERVKIQGVNQHHDLGSLGAAFNYRAAERQLDILREMGVNAIRMSHNPPAPELLEMTDRMGFVVIDEIFDVWYRKKVDNDFHLIFADWYEADLRSMIRRDRNHPSVILWSVGNEVGEQYTGEEGAEIARILNDLADSEDMTRPSTSAINYARPHMPFPAALDVINLNYQGEGIRDTNPYTNPAISGITTPPLYSAFHGNFTNKTIMASESASTLSTRGTYIFPVIQDWISAPVNDSSGGNSTLDYVSAYELYTSNFGASPDKVFSAQDEHSFVAGEFVWSGFDYLGEPTPYYDARTRSSYCGIVDLAGFPKDRFYLYQARWRPDLPSAHILPHWTWPERIGLVTPVHVFSSGDEAELFVNGKSQGRIVRGSREYRFRWDDVIYEPGEIKVVTYKNGSEWAITGINTTGPAAAITLSADRKSIVGDNLDLSFITATIVDAKGQKVPEADNVITFAVKNGDGEIVATDNGYPADSTAFPSPIRNAFSGLALAIVKGMKNSHQASLTITASAEGLQGAEIEIRLI